MMNDLDNDDEERTARATRHATLTGASGGAALGGVQSLLMGAKTPRAILIKALLGGAAGGALAGGSTYLGSKLLGAPDPDDTGAYTKRAGLGGAVGGGLAGAALGGLIGSGKLKWLAKTRLGEAAAEHLPLDNLVAEQLKKWAHHGGKESAAKGAALLGGGLGVLAGRHAMGEGEEVDQVEQAIEQRRKAQLRAQYGLD